MFLKKKVQAVTWKYFLYVLAMGFDLATLTQKISKAVVRTPSQSGHTTGHILVELKQKYKKL